MPQGSSATTIPVRSSSPSTSSRSDYPGTPASSAPVPLAEIERAVRSIRYGSVVVVIQDGVVLQIDKTEKIRLR